MAHRIARAFLCIIPLLMGTYVALWAQVDRERQLFKPRNENRAIRFGIGVGLNVMDFRVLNTGLSVTNPNTGKQEQLYATTRGLYPGFNVNALMRVRFTDNIHLRILPGICFGQRDLEFFYLSPSGQRGTVRDVVPIESAYIEMPILMFFSAPRTSNFRPYVIAGANVRADMAAFKKLKIEEKQYLRLQKFDIAYEVGIGFECYFPYFKMAPEIKWSGGFLNALAPQMAEGGEAHHGAIKSLTSQIFAFSLIFE